MRTKGDAIVLNKYTGKPLVVEQGSRGGPSLSLPTDQLPELEAILQAASVYYHADLLSLSFDNGPYMTRVHFGREGNRAQVQAVLDQAESANEGGRPCPLLTN
jgi:hypothetical protein